MLFSETRHDPLACGEVPDDPRLEPAKGFAQATHWLHLDADGDEDEVRSLERLLREAYEQNG